MSDLKTGNGYVRTTLYTEMKHDYNILVLWLSHVVFVRKSLLLRI